MGKHLLIKLITIGSNSLVTKDCEPWTIYVGSPAKAIKTRPKEKMLKLEAQLQKDLYDGNGKHIPKYQKRIKFIKLSKEVYWSCRFRPKKVVILGVSPYNNLRKSLLNKRKTYDDSFKAIVTLEAIKGKHTI